MNRIVILAGTAMCLAAPAYGGIIDPALQRAMEQAGPDGHVSALLYLHDRVDVDTLTAMADATFMPMRDRHELVVRSLQRTAADSQVGLINALDLATTNGDVLDYESFWVANVVRVDGTPAAIRSLADRSDIDLAYLNYEIELIDPVTEADDGDGTTAGGRAPEPGLVVVRAPEVWDIGITGSSVLVSIIDTGVDGNHPALADRWAGVADPRYAGNPQWAWFDPYNGNNNFPYDGGTHGTHVMGTVCGGAPGDDIGVAPGATWIAAGAIDRGGGIPTTVADAIESFEWLIDPDGDPSTSWDVPATCSNSWGLVTSHGYPPCDETFWSYIDNLEAAGCVVLFAAGNEGPSAGSLRRPGDRALDDYRTMAVAAVDERDPNNIVAGFSSRGPTFCTTDGSEAIKPDIAAPGVSTRSALPGGGYGTKSGTSMATPHVNGVIALVREANPDLSVDQVKQIIYDSARDVGANGKDNDYGYGIVDAYEAVQMALATATLSFAFPDGRPEFLNPNGGETIRVEVNGANVQPVPGTGKLHYSDGRAWTVVDMDEIVDNVYDAVFPGFDCGATVEYYFSVEGQDGNTYFSPFSAPASTFTGRAFSGVATAYTESLDLNPGWSASGEWAFGQPTGQGGTQFGNADPSSGATGNNVFGINLGGDYSTNVGSSMYLTTGAIDCSGLQGTKLVYQRWLNSDYQPWVAATLEISTNGSTWTSIWENGGGEVADNQWREQSHDISAIADGQSTVYFRWRHQVLQSGAWAYSGWNIDDVTVTALVCDEPGCPEDLNGDGVRDLADLGILLASYNVDDGGDINGDGVTDLADLGELLAVYDTDCP
jgi:subtilisin family serine protease